MPKFLVGFVATALRRRAEINGAKLGTRRHSAAAAGAESAVIDRPFAPTRRSQTPYDSSQKIVSTRGFHLDKAAADRAESELTVRKEIGSTRGASQLGKK